jgi:hypothetical protein
MNKPLDARDLRLRFVTAEDVLLHEESDPARVDRLRNTVVADGFLRNPPVAARTEDGRWVVLDGATRTTMLRQLGAEHILIQSVAYTEGEVEIGAWYHVLPDPAALEAEKFADKYRAELVAYPTVDEAHDALEAHSIVAALAHENGTVSGFKFPLSDLRSPFSVLRALVNVYGGAGEIYRIVHDDLVDIVRREGSCPEVVMFPAFTPSEIIQAATEQDVLPAGITRHLISGRALNLNLQLDQILGQQTLQEKNAWLADWLTSRILNKKVRYYHEPVFVFDD